MNAIIGFLNSLYLSRNKKCKVQTKFRCCVVWLLLPLSPLCTEPCRDPDLCKYLAANQPDASPCSQCVTGHLWGEVTNVVTERACAYVCVCASVMSLREKRVFATVSALATCLGLMRLVASRSDWLPAPAFVLFYSLHGCTHAQVKTRIRTAVIIRILKRSKNTSRNGRAYKFAGEGHL